ncbi:MAG TPA: signal peptidase I [Allosphingosinicella sp.]|nr:signal peptidase I [Allosphingosinicella sp.]
MTDSDRDKAAEEPPAEAPAASDVPATPDPAGEAVAAPEGLAAEADPADPADAPAAPDEKAKGKGKRKKGHWFDDLKAILWLVLAVLLFHSCVAKPFYIPSESMMPGLLKGDRLVVSKYPYGWSWVSPSFHILPQWRGRIWGAMPQRGDIVIVTPPGQSTDYIKRVIGLPGETVQVVGGEVLINGRPLRQERLRERTRIPVDENVPCEEEGGRFRTVEDGRTWCRMPVVREYLPDGRYYDTIDLGHTKGDDYPPTFVPEGHVFLMGDNRDQSADSRFALGGGEGGENGLGGPVPWENIGGRAEFITFSLDGTSVWYNPLTWFEAFRSGRAGRSLRNS